MPGEDADSSAQKKLIVKAVNGDPEAKITLCKEIARVVLARTRLLYSGGNMMDVEDIAQEVLMRVCNSLRSLKDPEVFNAWINTIIINEVRRHTKKAAKHTDTLQLEDYRDEIEEENEEFLPQEFNLKKEESGMIKEIIDALPERQREAIVLHYYSGLSVTETANVMGISHAGVSLYLKLARKKIKEELENVAARPSGGVLRRVVARTVQR